MLQYTSVSKSTLELLKSLMQPPFPDDFYLVGGTSLALQIGHRESIDLDLFTSAALDTDSLIRYAEELGEVEVVKRTKAIMTIFVNSVKVDFVNLRYPLIDDLLIEDGIRFATPKDIAAMKIAAITGRGAKKDFIDLYFLLQQFSMEEILDFYQQKYDDHTLFLTYKSLNYFEDADAQEMPVMFQPVEWETIKTTINSEVKRMFP